MSPWRPTGFSKLLWVDQSKSKQRLGLSVPLDMGGLGSTSSCIHAAGIRHVSSTAPAPVGGCQQKKETRKKASRPAPDTRRLSQRPHAHARPNSRQKPLPPARPFFFSPSTPKPDGYDGGCQVASGRHAVDRIFLCRSQRVLVSPPMS